MARENPFKPARRHKLKARVALYGPSKSGKTLAGLSLCRGLVGPGVPISVIDTENRESELYADADEWPQLQPYFVATLDQPYSAARYVALIRDAESAYRGGLGAILIDGLTPAWQGEGGIRDVVDVEKKRGNQHGAWDSGNREQRALLAAIKGSPCHVVATMRAKSDIVSEQYQKDGEWKTSIRKIGLKADMRDGFDYEFTLVGNVQPDHSITFEGRGKFDGVVVTPEVGDDVPVPYRPLLVLGARFARYLDSGAPAPEKTPEPEPQPQPPAEQPVEQPAPVPEQPVEPSPPRPDVEPPARPEPDAPSPPASPVEDAAPTLLEGEDPDQDGGEPETAAHDGVGPSPAQTERIVALAGELAELRPDFDWHDRISQRCGSEYGQTEWMKLDPDQSAGLIEALEQTKLLLVERSREKVAS